MKKSKYISSTGYNAADPSCFERLSENDSKTVQGESYTISELIDRYYKGLIVDVERQVFDAELEDFDSIDLDRLSVADPFEKQMILEEVSQKAKAASDAIEKWKREQKRSASSSDDDSDDASDSRKPSKKSKSATKQAGRSEASDERNAKSDASPSPADGGEES